MPLTYNDLVAIAVDGYDSGAGEQAGAMAACLKVGAKTGLIPHSDRNKFWSDVADEDNRRLSTS